MMAEDDIVSELVTFRSTQGSYVYAPIPQGTSYGHRAELWDVDKWLKEVKTKLVTSGDSAFVRLEDPETGELFAECPLPADGTSLTTAVEPVVDSSRYFVLRVAERGSKNHAFVGLGFRERGESSNFAAALDEYRLYLRRKKEAMQTRESFERQKEQQQQQQQQQQGQQQQEGQAEGFGAGGAATLPSGSCYALQGSIKLNIAANKIKPKNAETPSFLSRAVSFPVKTPDTSGVLKLQPPPAAKTEGGRQPSLEGPLPGGSAGADAGLVSSLGRLSFGQCDEAEVDADGPRGPAAAAERARDVACLDFSAAGGRAAGKPLAGAGGVMMAGDEDGWGDFVG